MFHTNRSNSMAQGRRTRAQWRQLVEGFSGSGLTQACYCERHGISVTSFQRWRAQFRQAPVANPRQAEASARKSAPVRLLPAPCVRIEVASPGRICVRMGHHRPGVCPRRGLSREGARRATERLTPLRARRERPGHDQATNVRTYSE
jgi:hypothetical protein